MRKLLSTMLAVCMVLTTFVFAPGAMADADIPTITYMMPVDPGTTISTDTYIVKEWGKAVGVNIELQAIPRDTFQEKLAAVLASRQLPDMINFFQDATIYKEYGPALFANLSEGMADGRLSNLAAVIDKYPEIMTEMQDPNDGNLYAFPLVQDYEYFSNVWYIRNDLLKAGGMDASEITDIESLKKAFMILKEQQGHDYITSSRLGFSYFTFATCSLFGTANGVFYNNRRPDAEPAYEYGPVTEEYKEWVEFMAWMYENKLLHPDFAVMQELELRGGLGDGTFSVMLEQFTMDDWLNPEQDPAREVKAIPSFEVCGYIPKQPSSKHINIGYRFPVVINKDSSNIDACMRAMDFIYSPEGNILMSRGVEGVDWVADESYPAGFKILSYQTPYLMEELGEESYNQLPQGRQELGIMNWWLTGLIPEWDRYALWQYGPDQKDYALRNYNILQEYVDNDLLCDPEPNLYFDPDESDVLAEITTPLSTYSDENVLKFITGVRPIEEWDQFVAELANFNYQYVVDTYNAKYSETMAE